MAKFSRGDIVVSRYGGRCYIFEGNKIGRFNGSVSYYSVIAEYDPRRCVMLNGGWDYIETVEVSDSAHQLSIPSDMEDVSYRLADESEKALFLKILQEHGYTWDCLALSLVRNADAEIVHTIAIPKTQYNGEVITHLSTQNLAILETFCCNHNNGQGYCKYPPYPSYGRQNVRHWKYE